MPLGDLHRARTRSALTSPPGWWARASVKGDRVGAARAQRHRWAVTAYGVLRIGAVLVPLSTLLRPPELLAQLATASVSHLDRGARPSAAAATSTTSRRPLPGLRADLSAGDRHPAAPSLRRVWRSTRCPMRRSRRVGPRMEARVRPADDMVVLFTSGSRGTPEGRRSTPTAAPCGPRPPGSMPGCVDPGERLYIPMPFFWTGGFSGGLLTALVAGATLLTEAEPEPGRTLALLERERATLFRGWPDQAAQLAAHPAFAAADLSSLGDGSLGAVLPAERRPAPGARANLFGMTETFGPYCGDRLDTDLPAGRVGELRSSVRRDRGAHRRPETGRRAAAGERARSASAGRTYARDVRRGHTRCSPPMAGTATGDPGRLDAAGYLWYRAGSTTCSRSRARRCTRPRSRPPCAPSTTSARLMSPSVRR